MIDSLLNLQLYDPKSEIISQQTKLYERHKNNEISHFLTLFKTAI